MRGDHRTEVVHPAAHCLVRHRDLALREQILDVTKAECEPEVEPNRLMYDLGRKPISGVADFPHTLGYSAYVHPTSCGRRDKAPDLSAPAGDSDFYFVPAEDPEIAVQRILELVKTRVPKRFGLNPIRDVQVLCPMNRGGVGARSLNIELQAVLNPAGERKVERFGWTFAPGDKVMQIENDYD